MSSYDDLLRQVESLRQVNSSLQREIQDNNAQLSRLQENSAHIAQYAIGTAPPTPRSQSNTVSANRPTNIQSPPSSRAQPGQNLSDRQVGSPPPLRPETSSAHCTSRLQETSSKTVLG